MQVEIPIFGSNSFSMPQLLAQKLRIKAGMQLLTIHAPDNFPAKAAPLPARVKITNKPVNYDQVHWFVHKKAEVEKEVDKVIGLLKEDTLCWIYYPKGNSGLQTDLTRDKGWDSLIKHGNLQWLSLISFDETWSAFGLRKSMGHVLKRDRSQAKTRPIQDYIDGNNKVVRLPADLELALKTDKAAGNFFNGLSFTNKKEYVEWIITAKKEETRVKRVKETLERLKLNWKNPRNL
jgi:hypothetical protein